MARPITIGNGSMLVGLDGRGQVRDLYYPYVGEANHVSGASGNFMHRIGVFVDGQISWLDDPSWDITIGSADEHRTGSFHAHNHHLGLTLSSHDAVHNEENIFLRHFTIKNNGEEKRELKLIISQQFRIYESRRGDTGFYDPRVNAIIHYKGDTTILVNAFAGEQQFTEFNIGLFGIEGKEGTYMDAVDGVLEKNPIEHGSVDSVLALSFTLEPDQEENAQYWVICGCSIKEVHALNDHVLKEGVDQLIASTEAFWQAWLQDEQLNLSALPDPLQTLYRKSLLTMRVHADNRGGIIASSDTNILHHGRDTYSYVWPRDGAYIAHAFDRAGHHDVAARFFEFVADLIEPGGYLMHKYRSDGTLGSSWHPWLVDGKPILPIQEDETASILYVLWEHYELVRDVEFTESLYNRFIEPAANFLCEHIDSMTGLPQPSFDLWEEKYGTSTYTAASVYGGLLAASRFAMLLGKTEPARTYLAVAQRLQTAIKTVLFDEETGSFVKQINYTDDDELVYDRTIDSSSLYGLIFFGVFEIDDERVERMVKAVQDKLAVQGMSAGYMRYEGDNYYRMQDANSPNPWVITTLWMADYYIAKATKKKDLEKPLEILEWAVSHATVSGVLPEQMHPETRAHLSTAPLVWSHAQYVLTVQAYLQKLSEFEG